MNDRLRRNLIKARRALLDAQSYLASIRMSEFATADDQRRGEKCVCRELDRVWEAQVMANGVFQ